MKVDKYMSTINNQVNSLLTVDNFKITPEDSTIPTGTSVTPLLTIDDFKILEQLLTNHE